MGEWVIRKLKELGTFGVNGADKKIKSGEIPVRLVNYMDVYRNNKIDNSFDFQRVTAKDREIRNCSLKRGDVLFTPSSETPNDIGRAAVVTEDLENAVYSYHVVRWRPNDPTAFDVDFLAYVFNQTSAEKHFISRASGITRYTLNRADFKSLEIRLPVDINEQSSIAKAITAVDDGIGAIRRSIVKSEQLKKALMQKLLTGKMKPDGTWRKPEEFWEDKSFGLVPNGWRSCKFKDLVREEVILDIQDGNHGEKHPTKNDFVAEGIPFIMACDISNGKVDLDGCTKIPKFVADKLRIGFAKPGDVLLSHKASIGFTALVGEIENYLMLTPQVTYYRCNKEKLLPKFLLYFFQNYRFQKTLEAMSKQSTRNYIGITNQKKLEICYPLDTTEQNAIEERLSSVDELVDTKRRKIIVLECLRKSLMQNLLTGKVTNL